MIRLLRGREVDARRGRGKSTRYMEQTAGTFPPSVGYGANQLYLEHEVEAVLTARVAGATDDELRALVARLVDERPKRNASAA